VRSLAVRRLVNQQILAKIALNYNDNEVRWRRALEQRDYVLQSVLADLEENDKEVRRAAVGNSPTKTCWLKLP
jgi:formyltetrahydrofolate synthetase